MIDTDLIDLKIIPANHLVLKDYNVIEGLEKKNKKLQQLIIVLLSVGIIIITYNIYKNDKREKN